MKIYSIVREAEGVKLFALKAGINSEIGPEMAREVRASLLPVVFAFGEESRGSDLLALAILLDMIGGAAPALTLHRSLGEEVISKWPKDSKRIELTERQILSWMAKL